MNVNVKMSLSLTSSSPVYFPTLFTESILCERVLPFSILLYFSPFPILLTLLLQEVPPVLLVDALLPTVGVGPTAVDVGIVLMAPPPPPLPPAAAVATVVPPFTAAAAAKAAATPANGGAGVLEDAAAAAGLVKVVVGPMLTPFSLLLGLGC